MIEGKAPAYIIDVREDITLVADTSCTHFWKIENTVSPSTNSTVPAGETGLHVTPPAFSFFDHQNNSASSYDAVIVGVPYNRGATFAGSTVAGFPDILRLASLRYPVYTRLGSTTTSGLYDLNEKRFLFQDLVFRDIGNMDEDSTKNPEALTRSIGQFTRWLVRHQSRFVAIGGDHSITYPFVCSLAEEVGHPVVLIDLDAHHDCKTGPVNASEVHHANFIRHLLSLECIAGIIQVGVRGIRSLGQLLVHPRLAQIPAGSASPTAVRSAIQHFAHRVPGCVGYLSIDMDVLDPSIFPRVDFPVAGGFALEKMIPLMQEVFHSRLSVLGIDLVEGLPEGSIERNDYDVPLSILAHCLDGLCSQRYKAHGKRRPWPILK